MSNLSEEEKQAIEFITNFKEKIEQSVHLFDKRLNVKCGLSTYNSFNTILNLIEKQQKEILHWKGQYYLLSRKINKPLEDKIREKNKRIKRKRWNRN